MPKLLNSFSDVALAIGTTQQNVSQWKAKGCPYLQSKPYDLDKVRRWADTNIDQTKASRKKVDERVEVIDRRTLAETEIKELTARAMKWEEAVREKKLVWAEDWEKILATQSEAFRRELMGIEHQAASKIIGLTSREQAANALHEIAVDILKRLHIGGP